MQSRSRMTLRVTLKLKYKVSIFYSVTPKSLDKV